MKSPIQTLEIELERRKAENVVWSRIYGYENKEIIQETKALIKEYKNAIIILTHEQHK